mmetsp:Transcript_32329/g.81682  ORF Transcript_32329/g.81682 Transcript_32329/m.81682 type:complete len:175 (+) Transcript_32329:213-737(+)
MATATFAQSRIESMIASAVDVDAYGSELASGSGLRSRSNLHVDRSEQEQRRSSSSSSNSDGSISDPGSSADSNGGAHPDTTSMNMLHCLFAMAFAALTLGVLTCVGLIVHSSSTCPPQQGGYSRCAMWQDFRSVLSFLLGALLCGLFTRGKESAAAPFYASERAEKVQLYAYML